MAEEHVVMLMGDAYFPEITYVAPGDSVQFVNGTDTAHSATATDGSWTSGILAANDTYLLQLETDMVLTFASDNNPDMTGAFSYDPAPLASSGD
ncbi:MAG: hypothetical protein ACLFQL_08520 [Paracoccaceae bacterium]